MGAKVPKLGVLLEPRLTNAGAWSHWFGICERLGAPDFFVARGPVRAAMMDAVNARDTEKQKEILEKFREENENFRREVRNAIIKNSDILFKMLGGSIVYLCAGVDFSHDLAVIAGGGRMFYIDHAESVIAHLRREEIAKNSDPPMPKVFKALLMSTHQICSREAQAEGLLPGSIDGVVAIRGLHRVAPVQRTKTLEGVQALLKPGGIFILVELFEDDRPKTRIPTPGAWYWTIEQYKKNLPQMSLTHDSGPVMKNQDDNCRLLVFSK
jgi:hypothetical protein